MAEYVCLSLADIMAERDRLSVMLDSAVCEMAGYTGVSCDDAFGLCQHPVGIDQPMDSTQGVCAGCVRMSLEEDTTS